MGNLPYTLDSEQLRALFAEFGEILDVRVISDKYSGRSKGFGFVEFATAEDADKAIKAMNDKDIEGRKLVVNVARPPKQA